MEEFIVSFLTYITSLHQPNAYDENNDKDREIVVSRAPLTFSPSVLISRTQVGSSIACVYQEVK